MYLPLFTNEAFSWLCSGDIKAADAALRRFPSFVNIDKGSPNGWLKALVALKNGDQQMATESLSSYLGRPLASHEEITSDLLLSLWDTPPNSLGGRDLAFYFPSLPPSITGLPHVVTRLEYGPPVLYINMSSGSVSVEAGARNMMLTSTQSTTDAKVILNPDQLEYRIEDQAWYAAHFPHTTEIDQEQINALSDEIDVVIITATNVELGAVMHLLEPYPRRKSVLLAFIGPETYYLGKFGAYKAVVTKCRMGSIGEGSVILSTTQAQNVWRPRAILMVGLAFGKDPSKQKIGDVLVASQIISYEQQRVGEQVVFRGAIPPSNTTLLNRFENAPTWRFARPDGKDCKLLVGPILSGEKLVDDLEFKAHLFQQFPQAIGGEMEGAGLCAASGRLGVAWILVKSICDWGDGEKHNQHQPLAAAAAVSLAHHVLSQKTVLNTINKP